MQKNLKKLFWQDEKDLKILIDLLKQNKVLISSTDTIYGFLSNTTLDCWSKIHELKNAPQRRPFLILVSSVEKLSNFVDTTNIPEKIINFVSKCWPGPVTFIFNAKENLPEFLSSEKNTIALRCPKHNGLQKILHEFDGLFSTSANESMDAPPEKFSKINPKLLEQIEAVVLDEPEVINTEPSTIVDFSQDDFSLKIVRQGAMPEELLKSLFHNIRT